MNNGYFFSRNFTTQRLTTKLLLELERTRVIYGSRCETGVEVIRKSFFGDLGTWAEQRVREHRISLN